MTRSLSKIKSSSFLYLLLGTVFILSVASIVYSSEVRPSSFSKIINSKFGSLLGHPVSKSVPSISPNLSPTPKATPKPLSFAEMNVLYGPCTYLPTFLYHHIQGRGLAVEKKQTALTVYTDVFRQQMQYLKDKGYNIVSMQDLINFFDAGIPIPSKSILLTFDDGYQDFYTDAYPILSGLGFKSTLFSATGLVGNPDYLVWDEMSSMNGLTLFANHTWSHKSLPSVDGEIQQREISTADTQLIEHGLNLPKVFAYPYGGYTPFAESYIKSLGYQLAFGTVPGSVLCKKQRFDLPRIRIGDVNLSYYGF